MQNTNELNICALKPIVIVFSVLFKYFGTLFYSSAHSHHSLKNVLLAFLSVFLLAPVALSHSLSLSDYSVALSKSNYMCLITSRAIKPLVRGARRSSLMMTIKKGERETERKRERAGRRGGRGTGEK